MNDIWAADPKAKVAPAQGKPVQEPAGHKPRKGARRAGTQPAGQPAAKRPRKPSAKSQPPAKGNKASTPEPRLTRFGRSVKAPVAYGDGEDGSEASPTLPYSLSVRSDAQDCLAALPLHFMPCGCLPASVPSYSMQQLILLLPAGSTGDPS